MKLDQEANGEKKSNLEVGGNVPEVDEPPPTTDSDDYPTGARLALIVLALAMSMFLVALDMVRQNRQ